MPLISYTPQNWYWNIKGGIFSSASGNYVPPTDPDYVAWLATGMVAPVSESEAALCALLAVQAPSVVMQTKTGLISYAAAKQAALSVGGIHVSVATDLSVEASTDAASLVLLNGAYALAQAAPATSFQWVQDSGIPVTLSSAQIGAIFTAVTTFLQATFTQLSTVIAAINAGTILTRAQVDVPPSPIPPWPVNS